MKFLLLFLSVIAAAFSMPNWAMEQHSFPMPQVPGYPYENRESKRASEPAIYTPLVQNTFEAGQTYLVLGNNNLFLSVITLHIVLLMTTFGHQSNSRISIAALLPPFSTMERLLSQTWEGESISS